MASRFVGRTNGARTSISSRTGSSQSRIGSKNQSSICTPNNVSSDAPTKICPPTNSGLPNVSRRKTGASGAKPRSACSATRPMPIRNRLSHAGSAIFPRSPNSSSAVNTTPPSAAYMKAGSRSVQIVARYSRQQIDPADPQVLIDRDQPLRVPEPEVQRGDDAGQDR